MQQNVTEESKRQRKNYNQRVSYWVGRGVSLDEAMHLASIREQMVATKTQVGQVLNLPGFQNPGPSAQPSENLIASVRSNFPETLVQVFCLMMVFGTSTLLVKASWQVFGTGWEGFLKAFLIETGILFLAAYSARSTLTKFLTKTAAVFLAIFSLFVLHAGVAGAKSENLESHLNIKSELSGLEDERARLIRFFDSLPEDHLKRREQTLSQIRETSSRIEALKGANSAFGTKSTIDTRYHLEALTRLVLTVLGAIFFHHAVTRIRIHGFMGFILTPNLRFT